MNCIILGDSIPKKNKTKGWNGSKNINKTKKLIQNQIEVLSKAFPTSKIIYVYGFDHKNALQTLETYKKIIPIYNDDFSSHITVNSINCAMDHLHDSCFIISGEMILKSSNFKNFDKNKSYVYTDKEQYNMLGCNTINDNKISHICYDLSIPIADMLYISNQNSYLFSKLISRPEHRNWFLFEIVNKMIELNSVFYSNEIKTKRFANIERPA